MYRDLSVIKGVVVSVAVVGRYIATEKRQSVNLQNIKSVQMFIIQSGLQEHQSVNLLFLCNQYKNYFICAVGMFLSSYSCDN